MSAQLEIARAHWPEPVPEWIEALAVECGRTSQNRVAAALGRSAPLISQVLRCKYPGDLAGLEERFRGVFMAATVDCPALGPLATNACQDWQSKARQFQLGSPQRARMYRACHRCKRMKKEPADADA